MEVGLKDIKNHIRYILKLLDAVEDDLKSAKNWGILDIINGKFLTSMIKHSKISSAENRLKEVIRELNLLKEELGGININFDHILNTGDFNKFMDIAFDNIFADVYTQSKINEGLVKVTNIKNMVKRIYDDINNL